ncbi:MAG: phage tail tape measure protein [Candidatus Nanopelagicaceae bacterium]
MADEQIVTNIVARADLSSLVTEVHKATASLQNLQQELSSAGKTVASQVKVINNSFGETLRSTGQFSSHFVTLHSDVEKFGRGLDSGRLKLRDYYAAFQQQAKTSGGLIRDLAKQQVMLQNAVMQPIGRNAQGLMQYNVHIPRGLDLVKNKTNLARMELQIMNRAINEGATALINWGKNTQWAGRQLTVGLTLPIASFGAAAAKAFREADQELTRLAKVYGDIGGATAEELSQVRKDIAETSKELAASMGVNFKETISLAADIAATGKTGTELMGSLRETTRLAVLGEVDRQEAMKATLAIQTAFQQNTEQLSQSINFLNAVENQTSTSLNDLVEAIPKAGPVIKQLGGSIQDLALYMTAMREGGINASESANALKSGLASLINPTKQSVGVMKDFGIDILGMVQVNAGNTTNLLLDLQKALNNLDPLQKAQAIEQLFGKFQFARISALLNNLGAQGSQTLQVLDLMKASASELESVAGRELAAVTESASGKYKRALEGLRAELSVVGEDFLEIGTKFVNVVTKLLKFLNGLPEPVKKLITAFGGLTAVAGPIIMLTGVLANFAGYLLKGATNLKALLSGSKGWKMLTPEIVAAEHAARSLKDTFYSDAQAAAVLEQALRNLVDEFRVLQQAASAGTISVQPAISTLGSNLIMPGGTGRVVDPTNPLVGDVDTRAFSHINPRKSGYAGQLLGVVPGALPVNRKIGAAPQIYMTERLPNIEGLTSIGGASTGIVAQEAAKFHALMATLGMQTEAEVAELKKVIALGGTVSSDLLNTYDDLLPITARFAQKAANESSLIVAELRAAKITVDEAKLRIMTLNAQIEREMMAEISQFAALRGRAIDFTKAPLMNQPVTDAAGQYTLRDMFKREGSRQVLEEFGRLRGVRTYGAPYSIETTRIPKLNDGGPAAWVPGPNINADVVPAMLTPGEYVIRRSVAQADPAGMEMLNSGQAVVVPTINRNKGGMIPRVQNFFGGGGVMGMLRNLTGSQMRRIIPGFSGSKKFYNAKGTAGVFIGDITDPKIIRKYGTPQQIADGVISRQSINAAVTEGKVPGPLFAAAIKASGAGVIGSADRFLFGLLQNGSITRGQFKRISKQIEKDYFKYLARSGGVGDVNNDYWKIANNVMRAELGSGTNAAYLWRGYSSSFGAHTGLNARTAGSSGGSTSPLVIRVKGKDGRVVNFGTLEGKGNYLFAHTKAPDPLIARVRKVLGLNAGGMVPGYRRGGGVVRNNRIKYGENDAPYLSAAYMAGRVPLPAAPVSPSVPKASAIDRLRLAGYLPGSNVSQLNIDPNTGQIIPGPAPKQMSMGKMMGLGMAGSMAGTAVGSPLGPIGQMIGGTIGFMLPQMIAQLGKGATLAANLSKLLKAFTIPGLVITAIGLAVKGLLNWKKAAEEAGKANRLAFGGTEDSFASVGINNFKTMTDRIKEINEALELHKAKVKSTFESYTQTGKPGLTLTIKELKEAIDKAKTSQKEYVNAFNNIDSSRVVEYAAQIKAQFVAMGMSAQEATNQIYAIIRASEKAGQALASITSKDFISISDTVSGISMLIKGLKRELKSEDFSAEEFNTGLDTLLNSLTIYKDSLVGTKDDNGQLIDQADALAITMEKIAKSSGARNKISGDNLEALKNENILYSAILGSVETIESISAKIMIYQSGFAEVVNLASLGVEEAAAFARNLAIVQNAMNEVTEDTSAGSRNPLLPLANIISAVKKDAETAANQVKTLKKVDEDYYKNKIESIQKVIKALEKEREARLKALDVQEEAQSYEIQLSQAQIRYKQAIATGDLALAAQEQLSIEQLVSDRQRQLTREQINNTYDAKIEKLEARIERLQEQLENAKDSYNAKTAAATQKAADLASLENYRDRLEALALKNIGKTVMSKTDAQEISNIFQEMTEAGGEVAKAASDMRRMYAGPSQYKFGWQQALVNALNQQVGGNADFKNAVDAFAAAVAKFKGESTPVDSSKINVETRANSKTVIVTRTIPVSELKKKGIKLEIGTEFVGDDSNRYSIEQISGKTATIKKRQSGGMFGPLDTMLVGERGPEIVKFNKGGNVYPNPRTAPDFGTRDPNQSFINRLLFGTKYIGGNAKVLKGEVPFGPGNVGKLVTETIKNGAKWSAEARAFQMAAIDKEAVENLFKMDLSKISLPDRLPSVNVGTARNAISDRLSGLVKGGLESFNANDWEIVQALRVMELSKKFPKLDLSDTKIFNELYAKEFYGLTGNPMMQLFKGVRNLDPSAAVSKGWRTAGGLPTYFSTNPYIAAMYSLMLGRRTPENLPMFAMNLPLSKLPGFLGEGSIRPGFAQGSMEFPQAIPAKLLSEFASTIKQYDLPGSIMGNWFNVAKDGALGLKNLWPRLHDWNDAVPGPYGQEIGAILKAGTEGVYQESYIKALQNGTMSSKAGATINMTNTYNIPQGLSKQEVGQYIVDLQKKELSKLGITRTF